MSDWKLVISKSTNAIFARRMIYKISEYQKKYPGLDVNSIAETFACSCEETKKEWATYTNNMKSIAQACRVQRHFERKSEEAEEWNKNDSESNDFYDGICSTNYSDDF